MEKELNGLLVHLEKELPGFVASGVVLVDDGMVIAGRSRGSGIEIGSASAHLANIVQSNLKTLNLMGDEQVTDDILITTDKYYFLIRHNPEQPFFHFVMTKNDEWLGRIRLLMKEHEKRIIRILD
jgi:predicted regulator of Ras-like GTPase activity (Roadblock/LC7/MglB family)